MAGDALADAAIALRDLDNKIVYRPEGDVEGIGVLRQPLGRGFAKDVKSRH